MKAGVLIEKLLHDGSLTDNVLVRVDDMTLGVTHVHVSKYGTYLIASEDATEYSVMTTGDLLMRMIKKLFTNSLDKTVMLVLEMYGDDDDLIAWMRKVGHVEYSDGVFVIFAEDER